MHIFVKPGLFHISAETTECLIFSKTFQKVACFLLVAFVLAIMPERIYNPITAMGFSTMFTFQLENTKR